MRTIHARPGRSAGAGRHHIQFALLPRVVLGFAAALCAACEQPAPPERPPARVQVVTIQPETLPRTIASVGSFESPDMTTVASEVGGRIVALDIPEGRSVEKGHILARLDDGQAGAALSVAQARLRNARDRLKRIERLRAQGVASEQTYDDAKSEFDAARGAQREASTRVEKTTISAPFTGVLGLSQVNVGQVVDPGTPIAELTQIDPLELRFALPQRYAGEVALEQVVLGQVGACGDTFEGRLQAIDPRVDPSTRSVRLQAVVPNAERRLYPGMAVSLRLVVGEIPDALRVPQEAIVRQGTKHIVYVIDAEGRAEQREVGLGQFFVDGVHVRSGLAAGERVVAAGQQKLGPGAPTEALPFEPTDNPNLELGRLGASDGCRPSA